MQTRLQRIERLEKSKQNLQRKMNKKGVWVSAKETDLSVSGKIRHGRDTSKKSDFISL